MIGDSYIEFNSENSFFSACEKDENEGAVYMSALQIMDATILLTFEASDGLYAYDYGSVAVNDIDDKIKHIQERSNKLGLTSYRGMILPIEEMTVYNHGDMFADFDTIISEYVDHLESEQVSGDIAYSVDGFEKAYSITGAIGLEDKGFVLNAASDNPQTEATFLTKVETLPVSISKLDTRDDVLKTVIKREK